MTPRGMLLSSGFNEPSDDGGHRAAQPITGPIAVAETQTADCATRSKFHFGWKKLFGLSWRSHALGPDLRGGLRKRQSVVRGGQPGTPAGSYIITVSATSGSMTHTIPVTLTLH